MTFGPGDKATSGVPSPLVGIVHLRDAVGGDQDVVVAGLRLDVLEVEIRVQVLGDVPLHVERDVRGLLVVVEDARLVADVRAGGTHAAAGILAIHERQARHRGAMIDVRGAGSFIEAEHVRWLADHARIEHAVRRRS